MRDRNHVLSGGSLSVLRSKGLEVLCFRNELLREKVDVVASDDMEEAVRVATRAEEVMATDRRQQEALGREVQTVLKAKNPAPAQQGRYVCQHTMPASDETPDTPTEFTAQEITTDRDSTRIALRRTTPTVYRGN